MFSNPWDCYRTLRHFLLSRGCLDYSCRPDNPQHRLKGVSIKEGVASCTLTTGGVTTTEASEKEGRKDKLDNRASEDARVPECPLY